MDNYNSEFYFRMREQSVKVVVRVRPLNQREQAKNSQPILDVDLKESQISLDKGQQVKLFCFDAVFTEEQSQSEVYESTGQPLIQQVIEGYNGTIFAYGQTGSGKTHTMIGSLNSSGEEGIIPRVFDQLVSTIKEKSNKNFLIQCSYIEIYNEEIHDLLSGNIRNKLEIRQSPEKGVFIKDVHRMTVRTSPELARLLKIGNNNRSVAETLMNAQSSRSHAIFTLHIESSEQQGQIERFTACKFNLVDLAGSERQSKTGSVGDRLKEASKINLSLSALGNVISALVDGKSKHVPYRDSKLTRLLQDSLGGNTKTIMIANISPCRSSYEQTLSTLRYASRAKYIQNAPVINEDPKDTLLREYEQQIKRLRDQLQVLQVQTDEEEKEQVFPSINNITDKQELIQKIRQLEGELIHPSVLKKQLIEERSKREQQISFMERNYQNLSQEVQEMRKLLKELRRKYKVASKQIFELEKEHSQERKIMASKFRQFQRQTIINRAVINTLFTEKQLNHLINMGQWQSEEVFKLPPFYFRDKSTLAFPYDKSHSKHERVDQGQKKKQLQQTKRLVFNNSLKKKA